MWITGEFARLPYGPLDIHHSTRCHVVGFDCYPTTSDGGPMLGRVSTISTGFARMHPAADPQHCSTPRSPRTNRAEKSMRSARFLQLLICVLAGLCVTRPADAQQQPLKVEEVMRALQARYQYLSISPTYPDGRQRVWPGCCYGATGGPPGPYPADGFYGVDISPSCAVGLVQSVVDLFWDTPPGLDRPLYRLFVVEQYGQLEGKADGPFNYALDAFGPKPTVNAQNFLSVLEQVREAVKDLKYISYFVDLGPADPNNGTHMFHYGGSYAAHPNCTSSTTGPSPDTALSAAKQKASCDWAQYGWNAGAPAGYPDDTGWLFVYEGACIRGPYLDPNGNPEYESRASMAAARGTIKFDAPDGTAGTTSRSATTYLFVDRPNTGTSNSPPVTPDSKWHAFGSGLHFESSPLANGEPTITTTVGDFGGAYHCPTTTWAIEWDKTRGWAVRHKIAIVTPSWDTAPDDPAPDPCEVILAIPPDHETESAQTEGNQGGSNDGNCGGGGGSGGGPGGGGPGSGGPPSGSGSNASNGSHGGHASRGGSGPGPHPESEDPVDLASGSKIERYTDLSIPLTGGTFQITRGYCSNPNLGSGDQPGLVGPRWNLSIFQRLKITSGQGTTIRLNGAALKSDLVFTEVSTGVWSAGGATTQKMVQASVTIDGQSHDVWRLIEPGRWEMDFERGTGVMQGRLLQERDVYQNKQTYQYTLYPVLNNPTQETPRVTAIFLNGDNATNCETEIDLFWILQPSTLSEMVLGKLASIGVYRGTGAQRILTHQITYSYKLGAPDDLGTEGDLIQVSRMERIDRAEGSALPFRTWITQYRYHDGAEPGSSNDPRLTVRGDEHQLKAVYLPEQIEFLAEKMNAGQVTVAAAELLELDDADVAFGGGQGGQGGTIAVELAAKIIGYDESDRVLVQYLQSSCGCAGANQGKRQSFAYYTFSGKKTTTITEVAMSSGTVFDVNYRVLRYDMELRGAASIPYLSNYVVEEMGTNPRRWVWHYEYDTSGNLSKEMMPSAVATNGYTPSSSGTPFSYTASTTGGLVYAYAYAQNRQTEVRVGNGDKGSVGSFDIIRRTTYVSGSLHTHLPAKIEDFSVPSATPTTDQGLIETTQFEYGFRGSTENLAWLRTVVEAELESENGPSGTAVVYDSYELFDPRGRNRWSRGEDMSVTYRDFDTGTGAVNTIVSNSDISSLVANDYPSLSTSGWGTSTSGGSLTTTFVNDRLGRMITRESPGGVLSYTIREMREDPLRTGLDGYYAEISLPHALSSTAYDGPVSITWYNARGRETRSSEFAVQSNTNYSPAQLAYTLGSELSRRQVVHHLGGLIKERLEWWNIADSQSPYVTAYLYDSLGRLAQTTDHEGTIRQNASYDIMNRVLQVKMGTDANPSTGNMAVVLVHFYDGGSAAVQGVGDGYLTLIRAHTGDGTLAATQRDTVRAFDYRGRNTITTRPVAPHEAREFDNLDRVIKRGLFSSVPSGVGSTTDSSRGLYTDSFYSQRGLLYNQRVAIDSTDLGDGYLESHTWFDASGRAVAEWAPNSPATKRVLDGHGRTTIAYTTDRGGDAAPGASGNYANATSVTNDNVLDQTSYTYDQTGDWKGRLLMATTLQRNHDDGLATGALTSTGSGQNAVASYVAFYYDAADRRTHTVNFGSNRSSGLFENGGSAPTWPPTGAPGFGTSDVPHLVSFVEYNSRGLVAAMFESTGTNASPTSRTTRYYYDDLSRRFAVVENYIRDQNSTYGIRWDSSESRYEVFGGLDGTRTDINRTTSFVYNSSGQVVKQVAHFPANSNPTSTEAVQITKYTYGGFTVGSAANEVDTLVASNDLLREVAYPDESTGEPGTTDAYKMKYAYNRMGELRSVTDQNGTRHAYERDTVGRVTTDKVTFQAGSGIDSTVQKIGVAYDSMGRLGTVKSYNATPAVVNAVEFLYTPLWQVRKLYQDHNSDITRTSETPTGDTRVVQYGYDDNIVGQGNWSRLTAMTYPDGTVLDYAYGTSNAINDKISRINSIAYASESPELAIYSYVGLDMFAVVDYGQADVQLDRTFSHDGKRRSRGQTTQGQGVYPGWDRFGRVIRHAWIDGTLEEGSGGVPTRPPIVEQTHTYDRSSNRLTRSDARPGVQWAGPDEVLIYDSLDRLKTAERGRSGTTWTWAVGSQDWALDMLGNWVGVKKDLDGNGNYTGTGESESRTHNQANELGQRTIG
ncbi:MAG: DUF6531 domain-containing protein, partial [Phycisphaerales bacterium]